MNNSQVISIMGLGKLGAATLATFASRGWNVIGIDINQWTVDCINEGKSPIDEPDVARLLKEYHNRIVATSNVHMGIIDSGVTFIIVPTPSKPDGSFSTEYVKEAIRSIAEVLHYKNTYHLINVTSTVLPGDMYDLMLYTEKVSGKKCGRDFGMVYNPDFIALGQVVRDLLNPDMIIIGQSDDTAGEMIEELHKELVLNEPKIFRTNFYNAELTKISVNHFLTLKIGYANTIAEICQNMPMGDAEVVLNAVGADTRIGKKYLRAGLVPMGPCVKPETLIQTEQGLKCIKDICIGDKVLTHKGHFRKVTNTYVRAYSGYLTKITIMGFSSSPIITTPEHPIWSALRIIQGELYRISKGKKRLSDFMGFQEPDFHPAEDLKHADSILMPIIKPDIMDCPLLPIGPSIIANRDLMFFLGFYISEGSAADRYRIKIDLHEKEIYYAEKLKRIIQDNFNVTGFIKPRNAHGLYFRFSHQKLLKYLKITFGDKADKKRVPWDWLALPDDLFISLLQGIWYGDGSRSNGRFTYATISYDLARFVQLSCFRLGIPSALHIGKERVSKDGVHHRKAYFICVSNGFCYDKMSKYFPDLFIDPSKGSNLTRYDENNIGFNIKKIEHETYDGDVFNLEVEEDNSYTLEWGVVHNCLPRDARAFLHTANRYKIDAPLASAVDLASNIHNNHILNIILDSIDSEASVAILGLSYKEGTPVIEESFSVSLAKILSSKGFKVSVYDPAAMENAKKELGDKVIYAKSAVDCLNAASFCFIATAWPEFRALTVDDITGAMTKPLILDAWGVLKDSPNLQIMRIGRYRKKDDTQVIDLENLI